MFLTAQFCEDYDVKIEKMYHMATLISNPDSSSFGCTLTNLSNDLDNVHSQLLCTEKTKELGSILDYAYDNKESEYKTCNYLYDKGFQKGVVIELTFYNPNGTGRPVLYIYVEEQGEAGDFAKEVVNILWSE